jgi:large subunit ribosomal protein L37Ae
MPDDKKVGLGPVKRYGVRYGRTTKYRAAMIEFEQRRPQKCPYCGVAQAHRLATGIWHCKKCDAKFAGPAYYIPTKAPSSMAEEKALEAAPEEEAEEEAEEAEAA